ncbi:MAG: hypothetical protein WCW26_04575 [Candidatus Buchananbacteria bacterium]
MIQSEVLAALQQAASPECGEKERLEIKAKLAKEIFGGGMSTDSRHIGFDIAFAALWDQAVRNDPASLPGLFPFFAALCGDRTGSRQLLADVDWSLWSNSLAQ